MNRSVIASLLILLGVMVAACDALIFLLLSQRTVESLMGSQLATISVLVLLLLYVWLRWRPINLEAEPVVEQQWGELIGDPQFDPAKGIYANVLIGSVQTKVLIQPKWWNYFSSDLIRSENEAACLGSPVTAIKPGEDPAYLVVIQDENGVTRGMGCRAKFGLDSVLLTAYHLAHSAENLYLAKYSSSKKQGSRVKLDPNWKIDFFVQDKNADLVAVAVPDNVWAALQVKTIRAAVPRAGRKPCQLFGADSSATVKSSSGPCWPVNGFVGYHKATTAKSWSGSPVVCNGFVVGVHRGANRDEEGVNKFTVLHPVLFPRDLETMYDEGHIREIDPEEAESRGAFESVRIYGRGDVDYSEFEYFLPNRAETEKLVKFRGLRGTWADMVEEEDDFLDFEPLEATFDSDIPLNYQGAGSACSPPSRRLDAMSSPTGDSFQTQGCPSLTLEDRVSNLEKLLEPLLVQLPLLLETCSANSKILTGLSAEAVRSSTPSPSKPPGSPGPKPPIISTKQSSVYRKSTPKVVATPPSEESGTLKASKRRSKRSRKQKSKATPPQESHSRT